MSQWTFSARRSRLGLSLTGPVTDRIRARIVAQTTSGVANNDGLRLGHLYVGFETPIVDVLVGRTYGLFGWGGKGFAPTTAAYRSVSGQIYELTPQVRVSHILRTAPVNVEVAAAAVAPPAGNSSVEWQLGLRLAFKRWRGAAAQGVGPAEIAPVQIALSALGRRLQTGYWDGTLPSERQAPLFGHGLALDLLVPIVPSLRHGLRNALTLTFEASVGSGIADLYPGLDGGFSPGIPIDGETSFHFASNPEGTVGNDASGVSSTIDWCALVLGAHYHLPIGNGDRLWISAVHSRLASSNVRVLTPVLGLGGIWTHGSYTDATLFGRIVDSLHASVALQVTKQEFADRTEARNRRTQVALYYFF